MFDEIVGSSPPTLSQIAKVALTDSTGADHGRDRHRQGVGLAIHAKSKRAALGRTRPLVDDEPALLFTLSQLLKSASAG